LPIYLIHSMRDNAQMVLVVILNLYDQFLIDQKAEQKVDPGWQLHVIQGEDFAEIVVEGGVNIYLDIAREQLSEGNQQIPVVKILVLFDDQIPQFPDPNHNSQLIDLVIGKILDQPLVIAAIRNNHLLPQRVDQVRSGQEVTQFNLSVFTQIFERKFSDNLGP